MNEKARLTSEHTGLGHPWLSGQIVVGIDGSEHSAIALRHAVQLAMSGGADIHLITAWQYPVRYGPVFSELMWAPEEEALEMLRQTVTTVFGEDVPENVSIEVREGSSAHVLIEASTHADLLVVGARGHGGFAGLLLGSVSTACAEHTKCPVLVVPSAKG